MPAFFFGAEFRLSCLRSEPEASWYRGESSGSVGEARSKHLMDHHAARRRANNEVNDHEGIHNHTTFISPYPTLEYA